MRRYVLVVTGLVLLLWLLAGLQSVGGAGATYTVNSTADPGGSGCNPTECTFREAIAAAAANPGTDTVVFDIPHTDPNYGHNTAGVWTIILSELLSVSPSLSGDIVDGTTQAANYGSDTNPYGPEIEISGEGLDPLSGYSCWPFYGSGNLITGLAINRCPAYGIFISGGDDNTFIGNYIGVDATGTQPAGVGYEGILLGNDAQLNHIGNSSPGGGNIISGNSGGGIRLFGSTTTGNVIEGNYIGTDRTGTAPLGNDYGIRIESAAYDNTIGPGNIIAYNGGHGVEVDGASTSGNTITQNSIHNNGGLGIQLSDGGNGDLAHPDLNNPADCTSVTGQAMPNATIEVFSDANGQGRFWEDGSVDWNGQVFTFYPTAGRVRGRMVTATVTDPATGNTSPFSDPVHSGCAEVFLPLVLKNQ